MIKFLLSVLIVLFLQLFSLNAQWDKVDIPKLKGVVSGLKILSEDVWMCSSYERFINTTNGGDTWNLTLLNAHFVYDLEARNSDSVYIVGRADNYGYFYKSVNSGLRWKQIVFDENNLPAFLISDIALAGNNTILICGDYNVIYKSTDEGETWKSCYTGKSLKNFRSITFGDSLTGYVMASYGKETGREKVVYKTENGGDTWDSIFVFPEGRIRTLQAVSKNIVYAAGQDSVLEAVFKTTDGGRSWNKVWRGLMRNSGLWSMGFTDENLGFTGGEEGAVYKTHTGGGSWSSMPTGTSAPVTNIDFINEYFGFCSAGLELYKWDNTSKAPIIQIDKQKIDFEQFPVGDSIFTNLEIINMGDLDLIITDLLIDDMDNNIFFVDEKLPLKIIPLGIKQIKIGFSPKQAKKYNSTLTVKSNAKNEPLIEIALIGEGLSATGIDRESANDYLEPRNSITIAPNPAGDYIEINTSAVMLNEVKHPVIKVYDVLGVCVLTLPCHSCESRFRQNSEAHLGKREEIPNQVGNDSTLLRIDVSGLPVGVYFVRVGVQVLRFVKM